MYGNRVFVCINGCACVCVCVRMFRFSQIHRRNVVIVYFARGLERCARL